MQTAPIYILSYNMNLHNHLADGIQIGDFGHYHIPKFGLIYLNVVFLKAAIYFVVMVNRRYVT